MWKFSVKKPYTVIVAVLLILILGVVSWSKMTTDLLPNITLPYVVVMTGYEGGSPEEVELVVTKPIEQAMATLDNIQQVSSVSSQGSSVVVLEFDDSVNMESVTVDTREKLDMISAYWSDSVSNPIITKVSPDMLPVITAAVDQEGTSSEDLTRLVNDELVPKLEGVNGVASVSVSGGIEKKIQVTLDSAKIEQINEQIRQNVESKFDDVRQQLLSARQELETNKQTLEEQLSEFSDGTTDAQQQMLNGKLQLLKAEIQLAQSQSELESKRTEIAQLSGIVSNMEQSLQQLQAEIAQKEAQAAALDQEAATLKQEIDQEEAALNEQKSALEVQIQSLKSQLSIASVIMNPVNTVMEGNDEGAALENTQPISQSTFSETEAAQSADGIAQESVPAVPSAEQSPAEAVPAQTDVLSAESETSAITGTSAVPEASGVPEVTLPAEPAEAENPELQVELKELQAQLQQTVLSEQQLALKKASYEAKKTAAESAHTVLEASRSTVAQFQARVSGARQELDAAQAVMAQAEAQIAAGSSQVTGSQAELDAKEKELNRQKEEAQKQLDEASGQLKDGEEGINEQLQNLEESRAAAISQATLDGKITEDAISSLLQAQNFNMPAGYVTQDGVDYLVRVGDKITDISELENLILFDPGIEGMNPIMLDDVAGVAYADNAAESYAKVNGNDGLILSIQKQNTYSTAEISDLVNERFKELEGEYDNLRFTSLMDQGTYIDIVIKSVLDNLIMGGILAIIILILFLKDIRPTFIIACSIPISVIFAIVLMYFSGITLNIISLSGLAVGVGMLVDNSVVVIENIYRLRNKGATVVQAAVSGAAQVAGAITSSTLTTICVFLPIVFVEGITKQLFVDMALTIAYSLLASLIIALTFVPAMAFGMLKKTKEKPHPFLEYIMRLYDSIIRRCLSKKWIVIVAAVGMLVFSVAAALSRGTAFMPESDSTQLTASLQMPDKTLAEDTMAAADQAMERILEIEDVDTVGAIMGSGGLMGGQSSQGSNSVSLYVVLKEDKKQSSQAVASQIEEACADLSGEVTAKGSNMDMSALGGSGISINIYGEDIDTLSDTAKEVAGIVADTEGTAEVSDGIKNPTPELRIVIDKEMAMKQGLTVAQAYMELKTKLAEPSTATNIEQGEESYSTIVTNPSDVITPEELKNYVFTVSQADGSTKQVSLGDIAQVDETETLSSINREGQKRMITVSASIEEGHNIGLVSQELNKKLKGYEPPAGYTIEVAGENETINESLFQLVQMILLGIAFIYFIMVAQFQSFLSPFIVMFTIPLAFTGGFLGLFITGNEISVIAMIGFVMLAGIVVNNGIVLVDYTNQLRLDGIDRREAIVEAGRTRMRPILMTAITTILGLLTMAVGVGMGADMMQPIAIVTIGGLSYATFMTLFVIPVLYEIFSKKKMKKIEESELEILED